MANSTLHEHAPHLSVAEARQASRGRQMLIVLIASVVLAAAALAIAWGWRAGDLRRADSSAASRIAAASGRPIIPTAVPASQRNAVQQNPALTGLNR